MIRLASRIAILVGLFALRPAAAETIVCRAEDPHRELTFDLDYQGRTVSTEVPVNWAWFGRHFVMFLHSVPVLGRTYATQAYTFDETANSLELCDYGTDGPEACSKLACLRRPASAPPGGPAERQGRPVTRDPLDAL